MCFYSRFCRIAVYNTLRITCDAYWHPVMKWFSYKSKRALGNLIFFSRTNITIREIGKLVLMILQLPNNYKKTYIIKCLEMLKNKKIGYTPILLLIYIQFLNSNWLEKYWIFLWIDWFTVLLISKLSYVTLRELLRYIISSARKRIVYERTLL